MEVYGESRRRHGGGMRRDRPGGQGGHIFEGQHAVAPCQLEVVR